MCQLEIAKLPVRLAIFTDVMLLPVSQNEDLHDPALQSS